MKVNYDRSFSISHEPDVLVCGIGCAGVTAAVAAGRMGAKTLAIEQWPFAGGNVTVASVNGCCGLADMVTGELAVGGIVLELLALSDVIELPLKSTKMLTPLTDENEIRTTHTRLPYMWDMEKFKCAADKLLLESQVEVLFHTRAIDVVVEKGRVSGVLLADREGIRVVQPKVVIDCTGDANIAAWAGVPFDMDPDPQPGTLEFYIGNVRIPEIKQELQNKCSSIFEKALKDGDIDIYGGPFLSWPAPNLVRFNTIRQGLSTLSTRDLTDVEIRSRDQAWKMYHLLKTQLDEFKKAYFAASGPAFGLRESRRIQGEYTLTKEDIRSTRSFEDAIVKGAWYLDRHPPHEAGYHPEEPVPAYDIPYRTLLPKGIDNMLVAGRSHSATTDALASSRVGVTAMGMGQGAGAAAAMAAAAGVGPGEIDIVKLRAELKDQGAVL